MAPLEGGEPWGYRRLVLTPVKSSKIPGASLKELKRGSRISSKAKESSLSGPSSLAQARIAAFVKFVFWRISLVAEGKYGTIYMIKGKMGVFPLGFNLRL